jgi:16S rRNA (adenine1518-N6/adenine1519-N6)-dimethyltransferase
MSVARSPGWARSAPRPHVAPRQVSLARLAEFGIRPKRSLGQNFLIDDNILGVILERLEARPDDVILEVGAGLGVLTRVLLDAGGAVHAFEIDRRLEPALRATVGDDPRLQLHMRDILEGRLECLVPPPTLCASNLPYNIAGPFLAESLVSLPRIRRYCVMVQREIAERLASPPGSKSYGSLSVWMQLHAEVRETRPLSRAIFYPRPHVDSSLVTMDRRDRHDLVTERPGWVRRVVDAAFAQRRKSLVNSLSSTLGMEKARVAAILETLGLPLGVRAEALAPEVFVALAFALLTQEGEPGYNVASRSGRGADRS